MDTGNEYQTFNSRNGGKYLDSDSGSREISRMPVEATPEQTMDLAWLFAVLSRRVGVMALAAIILSAISGSLIVWNSKQTEDTYNGSFQVLVEPVTAEGRLSKLSLLAQTGTYTPPTELTKVGVDQTDLIDYQSQIRVLTSPKLLKPVIEELEKQYPDLTYADLIQNLQISRITAEKEGKEIGTKILQIQYQNEDPQRIVSVLETLEAAYLGYSRDERLRSLRQGIKFIDEQLPELRQRVETLQGQLEKLRQQYDLNFPEQTARDLSDRALSIKTQKVDTKANLEQVQARYTNLEQAIQQGNILSILSLNQSTYQTLLTQLQVVESQIALQSTQFREDSPPMQVLLEKQQNLRRLLTEEAEDALAGIAVQIQELQARDRYLTAKENEVLQKLAQFPTVLREYSDVQRELEVATESLKQFLEKREDLNLDASQQDVPWEVISEPGLWIDQNGELIPAASKNTKRKLAIAVILSTLLGVGIGFIAEILHTVYHNPDEVKGGTKLPVLGAIPYAKKLKQYEKKYAQLARNLDPNEINPSIYPQPEFTATFLEAFRSLYTNISLLGSKNRPIRSLVICSAGPEDGKSTIALQLAHTAAALGQRVLLVDTDLRRPRLHLRLGLPNLRGLSDAVQSDLSLNDVIQQAPTEKNLFFLSAGQTDPDPIKSLSSQKMQYLMDQFQGFFDLVIYDTPPLVGLADAHILAANADGTILVVRMEKTDRSLLKKGLEELRISGASVLGMVANEVKGYTPSSYAVYHRNYRNRPNFREDVPTV
ncbi:GumC family protein [Oscillatoria salina]|uniref:GumC family protein n=1 Tax=Oscillatoria salina TaxID=331517 RepID=UPI0013BA2444|nr:tyrosine-protein kinase domain-containing protein [Oscillatoria salina]MBZ8180253.1 polysaccharide biosynthesis tyrosine autokinase [Oscillatoria salina IIICB1]NET89601.1 polysaccharide biosynthesis tyrosine autokinase [Kamptonema sp. SIO1D9]